MISSVEASLASVISQLASEQSKRAYRHDWGDFTTWLQVFGLSVLDAKPRHVVAYVEFLRERKKAKATIGRAISVVREVYGALVRDELVATNPAREVKNVKLSAMPRTPHLSEEQVQKLLNLPADSWEERRDHLCLCLLFGLAWRRSEVARLKIEDFDFMNRTVTGIFKGGKEVTVGVPEWLAEKVESWVGTRDAGALLPRGSEARRRHAVSDNIVYRIVKAAARRAGIAPECVTPHALRRSNITLGGERGVSLKARQLAVGHTSQATTERYDRARDAAKSAPGQVFADLVGKTPRRETTGRCTSEDCRCELYEWCGESRYPEVCSCGHSVEEHE